jgi:exopolyphosphatase/guanosine-5'-triphosphate,3'-diphosphate pyrophosphatase
MPSPKPVAPAGGASPLAVIDIGSNSARVVVLERDAVGALHVVAGTRAPLRLVHDVDEKRRLGEDAMARAMEALLDFRAIARGAGARQITAVATAAIREAENGDLFIARVRRELGIRIEIIDGEREAYFGCVGALRGLPVDDGLVFDLGGGSMQITRIQRRRPGRAISLRLGALRLSETFLRSDPPRAGEIRKLEAHVRRELARAQLPTLRRGQHLVGTGGTVRNLAKIDQRDRHYPINRLHGYVLHAARLRTIAGRLAETALDRRDDIAGLSAERADSIVGGALAIANLLEAVGAPAVTVSGQGVREGLAYHHVARALPPAAAVKETSLASLARRFAGWKPAIAERRRAVAGTLLRALERKSLATIAGALDVAARLLDIGRSIDFFNRHEHTADIVLQSELDGFTHEELALISAILRCAGDRHADIAALSALVPEREPVERAAVLLALADDIEERCPTDRPLRVSVSRGRTVVVRVVGLGGWRPRSVGARFKRAFGKALEVIPVS